MRVYANWPSPLPWPCHGHCHDYCLGHCLWPAARHTQKCIYKSPAPRCGNSNPLSTQFRIAVLLELRIAVPPELRIAGRGPGPMGPGSMGPGPWARAVFRNIPYYFRTIPAWYEILKTPDKEHGLGNDRERIPL